MARPVHLFAEVRMLPESVPSVPAHEVPDGVRVLDVRELDEWEAGHIRGAVHIPLGEVPARLGELVEQDDLLVVCRSGGRSGRAVAWLRQNGVDAINVAGGMGAWATAGRPMVSETGVDPFVR
jgi:rhodanese-related sulfurtransferase